MFARTDRLLLRPAWREDAAALHAAIADHAVARMLARVPWPYTLADAEAFCAAPHDPRRPALLIFARTRGAARLIGGVGLHDEDAAVTLGYWIRRDHWGLGFATEAARAAVTTAIEGLRLPRLTAHHFIDNPASGRVLAKLGFRAIGVARRRSAARDDESPAMLYTLDAYSGLAQLAA